VKQGLGGKMTADHVKRLVAPGTTPESRNGQVGNEGEKGNWELELVALLYELTSLGARGASRLPTPLL
jgi:hypothetical protein